MLIASRGDHGGCKVRVGGICKKVIGRIERYEAFRVPSSNEDARRMLDPNHLIEGGVQDE